MLMLVHQEENPEDVKYRNLQSSQSHAYIIALLILARHAKRLGYSCNKVV